MAGLLGINVEDSGINPHASSPANETPTTAHPDSTSKYADESFAPENTPDPLTDSQREDLVKFTEDQLLEVDEPTFIPGSLTPSEFEASGTAPIVSESGNALSLSSGIDALELIGKGIDEG